MGRLNGQAVLMRIFIAESDKHQGRPLYKALLKLLREQHIAGATVLRGIAGFGAKSHLHNAHLLSLSQDLPMVIEAVDVKENIDRLLPAIDKMVQDGLVTLEKVDVIRYEPRNGESGALN